ncbi:MAG: UDP-N-acetylglucosamine 2-epimerase (non-hydrolyzing) [Candidatus Polarisedimenticolaceae bacterium]|nr:UDP-N-acetylglucosamine 2-epimerase (non-hydrolyzing) [Candidatus Polarisedimenticolaceae bacterium]
MLKVMTVVGTRPELIKMSRVIAAFDENTNHILVHTGQNYDYELNQVFFDDLGIRKPDYFLGVAADTVAGSIANVIAKSDEVFAKESPDALLLYGDTNSCLCVMSAKRRKIPIFHMEAGNRCFDQRVPEEINRKVIDHLSDVNLVLSEHARRYLLNEAFPADRLMKTGSHMPEVLNHFAPSIEQSTILDKLSLTPKEFLLVSVHREENVDTEHHLQRLLEGLRSAHQRFNVPIVVSTHPRTQQRLEALGIEQETGIQFLKPFGFFDYIKLQMNAMCVLSDSGTITEEASLLGFPAVTMRQAHERPEGMDEAVVIMCGIEPDDLIRSIEIVTRQNLEPKLKPRIISDYQSENVSEKVLRIVHSYVHYVNRVVWSKSV